VELVVMAELTGQFEIGVDIGGTFTDVVCRDDKGAMRLVKIPTTRRNPSAGVKAAMDYMQREWRVSPMISAALSFCQSGKWQATEPYASVERAGSSRTHKSAAL